MLLDGNVFGPWELETFGAEIHHGGSYPQKCLSGLAAVRINRNSVICSCFRVTLWYLQ